jgi:lipoprotein-anchoring transpeptidase ErfK/SrfK
VRILVTGSAGFIGCHVSALLRARGHWVVGLDSDEADVPSWLRRERSDFAGLSRIRCDISHPEALAEALATASPEVVVHLAARPGVAGAETQKVLATATRPTVAKPTKGKHIEVDIEKQVLLLENGDKVLSAIHVSTGAAGNTPRGSYSIIRKENPSWVPKFKIWLAYTSYFVGGFALHEYPDVPGYPASHGCVRISSPFSAGVYEFASYGTPIYLH